VSTAQTNRSDALPATAPEIASHAREAHADLLDQRSPSSCCSFAREAEARFTLASLRAKWELSKSPDNHEYGRSLSIGLPPLEVPTVA
jgi:hypothetical protein